LLTRKNNLCNDGLTNATGFVQCKHMNILFIGGTGNISGDCAELLYRQGHATSVITRGQSKAPAAYTSLVADRKNREAMRAVVAGRTFDVVVNFLGYDVAEVAADYEVFRERTRQYIFISTATVYSKPPVKLPITEDAPRGNAFWEYAQKKVACELWLEERKDFPVTIVRPSHTYSKRWAPNVVSSAGYTLAARFEAGLPVFVPDDGENPWTLTATSDFAVGLAGLAGNERAIGEAFHITGDEVLTWNQIYAETAAAAGANMPRILKIPTEFICQQAPSLIGTLKSDKAHPGVFDNSKIKRFVPEFRTRKNFATGIRESIAWMREHPEDRKINAQANEIFDRVCAAWQT
jgi:nucleoside-diphosphate-sugar epimerase